MKNIILLMVILCIGVSALSQKSNTDTNRPKTEAPPIRQYFFVMLLKGANRNHDSATAAAIQEGHMANIRRLYNDGKLKVAGPFGDEGEWRGIFIFDCATKEEVDQLLKTDPAVKAGRLAYEIHPWYTQASGSFIPGKPVIQ